MIAECYSTDWGEDPETTIATAGVPIREYSICAWPIVDLRAEVGCDFVALRRRFWLWVEQLRGEARAPFPPVLPLPQLCTVAFRWFAPKSFKKARPRVHRWRNA